MIALAFNPFYPLVLLHWLRLLRLNKNEDSRLCYLVNNISKGFLVYLLYLPINVGMRYIVWE